MPDQFVQTLARAIADEIRGDLARLVAELPKAESGPERFFKEPEAARLAGVSPFTLGRWRREGRIKPARAVRPILYDRAGIEAVQRLAKGEGSHDDA